jgi:DNA-binding response OmpR family regulator
MRTTDMPHAQGVTSARPRVMVVEDELVVAMLLEQELDHAGFDVVGPFARLDEAVRAAEDPVDAALLDVNLRGEMVFPAARILIARGVPVVFCSGYTALRAIPAEFSGVPQVSKPYEPQRLIATLRAALPGTLRRA